MALDHAHLTHHQLLDELRKARNASGMFSPISEETFQRYYSKFSRLELSELIEAYSATPVDDYDPTDEEQGPLEQGWAVSRRYDLDHKEDSDG